jgi:uncharacterized membrane protein YbhN (UPF0104 family)
LNPPSRSAPALRLSIGAALLVLTVLLVERYVGWAELLRPWRTQRPGALGLGVTLVLASYALRAVRVYDHFRPETRHGFGACLRLTLIHNLLNNLVPMRLGEVSFPALLRRYFGVSLSRGVAGLLWFRLTDLHILGAAALVALTADQLSTGVLAALLGLWLTLPWLAFRGRGPAQRAAHRIRSPRLRHLLGEAIGGMPADPSTFWRTVLWTVLNWLLKLAVFAWLLHAFAGAGLSPSLAGALGGELSSVLPVHGLAGAGTYEAGVIAGLAPFGLNPREALAAAVNLHLFLLGVSAAGGLLALVIPRPTVDGCYHGGG